VSKPHVPFGPASSPDDDPTGVRALLSGLPEPEPMPSYLVERINASLTTEQSQRASQFSGAVVIPLTRTSRRRPGRLLFAIAGAAAVVLVAVAGGSLLKINQPTASTAHVASALTPADRAAGSPAPPGTDKAVPDAASAPALIQIRVSGTKYTKAGFATQAKTLSRAEFGPSQLKEATSPGAGPMDTEAGLTDCLRAVGVMDAKMVRADLAFYEEVPAVIIVATTNGVPTAYALGRGCSLASAPVLHPATPLP
jgi:hypothetical protein